MRDDQQAARGFPSRDLMEGVLASSRRRSPKFIRGRTMPSALRRRIIGSMAPLLELPPGPRMPSPLQSAWYGLAPVSFLDAARRRHGSAFTLRAMGLVWTVLTDPAAGREV